jgi:hypothetical protein
MSKSEIFLFVGTASTQRTRAGENGPNAELQFLHRKCASPEPGIRRFLPDPSNSSEPRQSAKGLGPSG